MGVQVDVSAMAKEAGFTVPAFMTVGVFSTHVEVPEGMTDLDENGRLWDIINVLRWTIKRMTSNSRFVELRVIVRNSDSQAPERVNLLAEIGRWILTIRTRDNDCLPLRRLTPKAPGIQPE